MVGDVNVFFIANFFIEKANDLPQNDEFQADGITHLKLQKMLYFAQAVFLVYTGKALFPEKILARKYGPVIEEIYETYKGKGREFLEISEEYDLKQIDTDSKELLNKVRESFSRYSASELVSMTHCHLPWRNTDQGEEISHKSIMEFYHGRLVI